MAIPEYGAAPLAKFFLLVRGLTLIAMICIVGITANFVSEIVSQTINPPKEVVATLAVTCIAAFYCLISIPLFYARAHLGLLVMTAIDSGLLLAFIIIAVVVGKPLSFLNCSVINSASDAADAQSAAMFAMAIGQDHSISGSTMRLTTFAATSKMNCYETKAVWGMCVGLCILFASSCLVLPMLFFKNKKAGGVGAKSVV